MSIPPNTTLYIKNLNDQVKKDELRAQLYGLFLPHGRILDVVACKTAKMRGQAFITFEDLKGATAALRAWEGEMFYDKPMHIEYARSKSYAALRQEDPLFIPKNLMAVTNQNAKREREDDGGDSRVTKKERVDEAMDEDADEEMEIE